MTLRFFSALVLAFGSSLPMQLHAQDWVNHPAPYAKVLAERIVTSEPGILDAIFHVTPPGSSENYAVAAHTPSEQGSRSGDDDLAVISTGKSVVEVQKDGRRIGTLVRLYDRHHETIGAIGIMYNYHAGEDPGVFLERSEKIRDRVAKEIASKDALFQKR